MIPETTYKHKLEQLLPVSDQLIPNITQESDFHLAYLEYNSLSQTELLTRAGYFKTIGNTQTDHYKMCNTTNTNFFGSAKQQEYQRKYRYAIRYASHGIFPYKGKFHPQLIRGILNSIPVTKEMTVLDPMCGSGTTNIEAALLGIDSIALDVSPFCRFMTQVKSEIFSISAEELKGLIIDTENYCNVFSSIRSVKAVDYLNQRPEVSNLAFLAYLDAVGYTSRNRSLSLIKAYKRVLKKYVTHITPFLNFLNKQRIGSVKVLPEGSAKKIPLPSRSVDVIITSPPYTDMIDYVKNDYEILKLFVNDPNKLYTEVMGLRGSTESDRIHNYLNDLKIVLAEYKRILKTNGKLVMIIGFNSRQDKTYNLRCKTSEIMKEAGFQIEKKIHRQLEGTKHILEGETLYFLDS